MEIAAVHKGGSGALDELVASSNCLPSPKKQRLDHSKISKSIADIFQLGHINLPSTSSSELPKFILIEGAPGIGKTLLIKEIAYRWAMGEILGGIELVFLIYFRNPHLPEVNSLEQLLRLFNIPTKMISTVNDYIFKYSGQNVAFLMDGYDEYPSSLRENTFIVDIIMRKCLSKSTVLVTSRPTATAALHSYVDKRIEILGLAEEDRKRYISESLSDLPGKEHELYKYLKQQPTINGLCFVPLHLAILLHLFREDSLPETLTEMNESFIIHTVYRYLKRNPSEPSPSDAVDRLKDLPESILGVVYKLSALAFEGLQKDHLVFTWNEIKTVLPEIFKAFNGYGILQAVEYYPPKGAAGTTTSFNFLHYTMQEFLAALHVSTLPDEQQLSLMKKKFWDKHYNFMWMMYVGIVGTQSVIFDNFISKGSKYKRGGGVKLLNSIKKDKTKLLHLFQCYTEAKSNPPYAITSMFKDGKIKFNKTLLPHHVSSLIMFVSRAKVFLSTLELRECHLGDNGMNILKQFIADNKELTSHIGHIDLLENDVSPWGVYCATIEHCSVNNLTVFGDDGMEDYIKQIENSLQKNEMLQSLTLYNIGKTGLKSIQAVLDNSTLLTLKKINLSWLKLDKRKPEILLHTTLPLNSVLTDNICKEVAVNILWDGMKNSTSDSLDMSYKLNDDILSFIVFGLHNNKTVCKLNLSNNKQCCSNEEGITAICNCIKNKNNILQELCLSNNSIRNKVQIIAEALQATKTLQKLDISNNHICDDDVKNEVKSTKREIDMSAWHACLPFNNAAIPKPHVKTVDIFQIKKLNIACNNISSTVIGSCIENNSILQELDISGSSITDEGAAIIAKAITINSALQILDISKNFITSEGLLCLLKANLKELSIVHNNVTKSGFEKIECCILPLPSVYASWNEIVSGNKIVSSNEHIQFESKIFVFTNSQKSHVRDDVWSIEEISNLDYRAQFLTHCLKEDTMLQELVLYDQNIDSIRAKMLAKAIELNTALRKLDISHNTLSDEGTLAFSECLIVNKYLQDLNMSQNNIGNEGAIGIADAMKVNTTLLKLDISKNWIISNALIYLLKALKSNSVLQFLNITHNNVIKSGFITIQQCIKQMLLQIKVLISWNEIEVNSEILLKSTCESYDPDIGDFSNTNEVYHNHWEEILDHYIKIQFLSNCLKETDNLQNLNLRNNNISDTGAALIAQAIEVNKVEETLNISCNKFSDDGVTAICNCLTNNYVLQELYMSENEVSSKGANEIAKLIGKNISLKVLDISSMCIHDDGVTEICKCLKHNTSLHVLDLSLNKITDIGAKEIAEALKGNTTLQKLNITGNKISDDGASSISASLKHNHCLKELYMSDCDINSKGAKYIAEAIEVNRNLHTLHLHQHCVDDSLLYNKTVLDAVHYNDTLKELKLPWVCDDKGETMIKDIVKKINKERTKRNVHISLII